MGIVGLLLFLLIETDNPNRIEYDPSYHQGIDRKAPNGMKSAYTSSLVIKAINEDGGLSTGSANLFRIHNKTFILTAAHVVTNKSVVFAIERSGDLHITKVVMVDEERDLAIIVVEENLKYTKAIEYNISFSAKVASNIHYCGHPNSIEFTCYSGAISGSDGRFFLADMFAWPGSSGSVAFDDDGRVIGVVSALAVAQEFGQETLLSHVVLAGPTSFYTRKLILEILSDVAN